MFTKDMSLMEALQAHPKAKDIFKEHAMACLSCMGAMAETIESGARMHGIDLDTLLDELNNLDK